VLFGLDRTRARYPNLKMGVLLLKIVANVFRYEALETDRIDLENELRARYGASTRRDLLAIGPMKAYDEYYRAFGKPYQLLPQLESIVRKGRSMPPVSPLVLSMFMAEMKNLYLTAGHDYSRIEGRIELDVADGTETYTLLAGQEKRTTPGDLMMRDAEGVVSSVVYGPDGRTKMTESTTEALFIVYVPFAGDEGRILAHLDDIAGEVRKNQEDVIVEERAVYS